MAQAQSEEEHYQNLRQYTPKQIRNSVPNKKLLKPWASMSLQEKRASDGTRAYHEEKDTIAAAKVDPEGYGQDYGREFTWVGKSKTTPTGYSSVHRANSENKRTKADARVGVRDDAVLEGKTRKKLRKSEQLRAQRRSTRRLRVGGNLSIGTKGDSGVGTGGSKKSSLNIPKG